MKRIILLFTLIGLSINTNLCAQNSYWSGADADAKAGGKDVNITTYNSAAKYEVLTETGLAWISESVNNGKSFSGETVTLNNNLDLKDKLWTPIGNSSTSFDGTFDGLNHLISNMTINITSNSNIYAGLFGMTESSSTIKNLQLEYFNITTKNSTFWVLETIVGGIVGKCSGSVSNCSAIGSLHPSTSALLVSASIGLIAGSCNKEIEGCYVKGLIDNNSNLIKAVKIGGICGNDHLDSSTSKLIISNCICDSIQHDGDSYSRIATKAKSFSNNFAFANIGSMISGAQDNKHGESFTGKVIKEPATELTGNQDYVLRTTIPNLSANFNGKLITTDGNIETLDITGNVTQRGVLAVQNLRIEGSFSQQGTFSSESLEIVENAIIDGTYGINNNGKITYHRDHQIFASKSKPDGWYSLCLPFDANICVEGVPIRPLSSASGDSGDKGALHYWLKDFSGYNDSNVEFFHSANITADASTYDYIKSNKPYIYALPGPEWGRFNLVGKTVTFEGYGPIESFNDYTQNISYGPFDYTGSFINQIEKNNLYILDEAEGMYFYPKKESDLIKPYRAYFSSSQTQEVLKIANGSANDTQIEQTVENNKLKIYGSNSLLRIESEKYQILHIFDLQGRLIRQLNIEPGVTTVDDLPKGIYIIDNKRIAI